MAKVGFEAKLYRNEGTYETPDRTELVNIRDLAPARRVACASPG